MEACDTYQLPLVGFFGFPLQSLLLESVSGVVDAQIFIEQIGNEQQIQFRVTLKMIS